MVPERSHERRYTLTQESFTKSELRPHELPLTKANTVFQPLWSRERLQNEAQALQFIAANSRIPVPEFISLSEDKYGLLHLKTKPARGVPLDQLLDQMDPTRHANAIRKIDSQLTLKILPQLNRLQSRCLGSVDPSLPLMPNRAIVSRDNRSQWQRSTTGGKQYSFHHCDLGQSNIFVDEITFDITDIVDWEFAGFYPDAFEIPYWRYLWNRQPDWGEQLDELIKFLGQAPGGLQQLPHPRKVQEGLYCTDHRAPPAHEGRVAEKGMHEEQLAQHGRCAKT